MNRILIVLLAIVAVGCSNVDEVNSLSKFNLLSSTHSSCLGTKSAFVADDSEQYIVKSTGDGVYLIEHNNVSFNCCLPEGIEMNAYVKNDTIFYSDCEKVAGNCRCLCLYNTEVEVGGIEDGEYVLCFISNDECVGSVELNFGENLNEQILVSDLADNE